MPKAQSKECQRKKRNEQEPGENQQQLDIDSEDKEGAVLHLTRRKNKHIIVKFHDDCGTYFGDGVMRDAKVEGYRLYELPLNRKRRVMASFKPGDSGGPRGGVAA